MEKMVKDSILDILSLMIKAIEQNELFELGRISNNTIHSASIYQDEDSISIAVIAYSLSKISQRLEMGPEGRWLSSKKEALNELREAKESLLNDRPDEYKRMVKEILKNIGQMDRRLKMYIEDVIDKAKIKKGSAMYSHGISLGRVSELLGISQWELMSYLGNTIAAEPMAEEMPINKRIEFVRRLFGL